MLTDVGQSLPFDNFLDHLLTLSECWSVPFAPKSPFSGDISEQPKIVAPASTLQLVPKGAPLDTPDERYAIPKGTHWVDLTEEGSVLVIEQPPTQTCAAIGGIMALRMKARAVKAAVIGGRVRDLAELRDSKLPVSEVSSLVLALISFERKKFEPIVPRRDL